MKESLTALIEAVHLRDIRISEGSFRASSDAAEPEEIHLNIKTDTGVELLNQALRVRVDVRVEGVQARHEGPSVSSFCVLRLTYELPDGFQTDQETAAAFAEVNGLFNAWPFARAFVHQSFAAMGLAPYTLPVLRLKDILRRQREANPGDDQPHIRATTGPPAE